MTLSLTGPLNQLDVYRIVHDFDQVNFKTAKELPKDQADRIFVIIQVERKLYSHHLPVVELIDQIMRLYLENCPSVVTLLMLYNTSAIVLLHPLPLSNDSHYINTASHSFLVQLNKMPSDGKLASYRQLMTTVFKHHYKKLTLDQKLELIQRSLQTSLVLEEKSTSQKLELLGKIQAPTTWGKAKVKLQFLSWKVQYAAVWALENDIISLAVYGPIAALAFASLSLWFLKSFSYVSRATYKALNTRLIHASLYSIMSAIVAGGVSLASTCLGLVLRIPIFSTSLQEKGAWLQSVGWNCLLIAGHFLAIILPSTSSDKSSLSKGLNDASEELQRLLLQSINEAYITTKQNSFIKEQHPNLMNEWLQLTLPSDTNTGSSLTLQ
jgi:hypothetical protein